MIGNCIMVYGYSCFAPNIRIRGPHRLYSSSVACQSCSSSAILSYTCPRCAVSSPLVTTHSPSIPNVTPDSRYILLILQNALRTSFNPALNLAVSRANFAQLPLLAITTIPDEYPELGRTIRHRRFLLEGLCELKAKLLDLGVPFIIRRGNVVEGVRHYAAHAKEAVIDVGYLREERSWREDIRRNLGCTVFEVETNVLVPVRMALDRQAYGARMIRSSLWAKVPQFTRKARQLPEELVQGRKGFDDLGIELGANERVFDGDVNYREIDAALRSLDLDTSVSSVAGTVGGYTAASRRVQEFVDHRLEDYAEMRNSPSANKTSCLSPYLHFGFISPIEVFLATLGRLPEVYPPTDEDHMPYQGSLDKIADELVARRELAINFVYYNDQYDSFASLPEWARATLALHAHDTRPIIYGLRDLESAKTHDVYWNAAQRELLKFGRIHQHMRKYWGKKVLEWSETPELAHRYLIYLNNKYALDGSDPNSFAAIAWVFGLHDRQHPEREIYGRVRCMTQKALTRKFFRKIDDYVASIDESLWRQTQTIEK